MTTESLKFKNTGVWVDREYRGSAKYQWARELTQNGLEAGANRIEFNPEWQGVKRGVYRLMYSDNGCGMSKEQLTQYMSTLGEGGKSVGGAHENFAVGVRMTLLPWNTNGVIVASLHNLEVNTVLLYKDADSGEYRIETGFPTCHLGGYASTPVIQGIDVMKALPKHILEAGHGTMFILLGSSETEDTVRGDVLKGEQAEVALSSYLNSRYYSIPEGVSVKVTSMRGPDKTTWPVGSGVDKRMAARGESVTGLSSFVAGCPVKGTVELENVKVHWFLRDSGFKSNNSFRIGGSSISVLYRNELYSLAASKNSYELSYVNASKAIHIYNSFGLRGTDIRSRVTLVIEPNEITQNGVGVAPETSRSNLKWCGGSANGSVVKLEDFAAEFADNLPTEILDVILSEEVNREKTDEARREKRNRVLNPYFTLWNTNAFSASKLGKQTAADKITADRGGSIKTEDNGGTKGVGRKVEKSAREELLGRLTSKGVKAKKVTIPAGTPELRWVSASEMNSKNLIAQYMEPTSAVVNGEIWLNKDSTIVTSMIESWVDKYCKKGDTAKYAVIYPVVENTVRLAYEISVLSRVSHICSKAGVWFPEEALDNMLNDDALSGSLMGIAAEDNFIKMSLGYLGKRV